jgi:hypothetical protein
MWEVNIKNRWTQLGRRTERNREVNEKNQIQGVKSGPGLLLSPYEPRFMPIHIYHTINDDDGTETRTMNF